MSQRLHRHNFPIITEDMKNALCKSPHYDVETPVSLDPAVWPADFEHKANKDLKKGAAGLVGSVQRFYPINIGDETQK